MWKFTRCVFSLFNYLLSKWNFLLECTMTHLFIRRNSNTDCTSKQYPSRQFLSRFQSPFSFQCLHKEKTDILAETENWNDRLKGFWEGIIKNGIIQCLVVGLRNIFMWLILLLSIPGKLSSFSLLLIRNWRNSGVSKTNSIKNYISLLYHENLN